MDTKEIEYLFGGFVPFEHNLLVISYANFLLDINLENGIIQFSKSISSEISRMAAKVDWFIRADDYLLATDMWGNHAYLYEPKENRWIELEISCHGKPWGNFIDVFLYHGYIYIIPRYREFLVKIDFKKRTVLQMECPVLQQIEKERVVSCRNENFIYFFERYGNKVFAFDLKTGHYTQKELPDVMYDIVSIRIHKDTFFILSECGCLDSWEEGPNVLHRMAEPIGENGSKIFTDLAVTDQNIWLLPQLGDDIYILDCRDGMLKRYDEYPSNFAYADVTNYSKFAYGQEYREKIYFGMHSANHLLEIDKKTGTAEWLAPILPTEQETYLYRQRYGLSFEEKEKEVSLHEYVKKIPQMDDTEVLYENKERTIGAEIWETLKCEGREKV